MKKNTASAPILPQSHTAQRFLEIFSHPYRFLEAPNPYVDPKTGKLRRSKNGKLKPDWRTETKYPIRPCVLWERFKDVTDLIGLSFGTDTKYLMLDVDITSRYHPINDEAAYQEMLGTLEDIGLVRPIIIQSSWSKGLNVYFFLSEAVNSFNAACALQETLIATGFKLASGQLELFPNTKRFNEHYKAHKLPLQPFTGSYVLDDTYCPIADNLDTFLNMADVAAKGQDMQAFKAACQKYGKLFRLKRCGRKKDSLENFLKNLRTEISPGFTAPGQTNEMLWSIGTYGVVGEGLDEDTGIEPLADYIVETVVHLPGYAQFCNHQHEIEKRAREIAKSCQRQYWAAGKPRKRQGNYKSNRERATVVDGGINQQRSNNALQRLIKVLERIQAYADELPPIANFTDLRNLLNETSKALFDKGFSNSTLKKPEYQKLLNPVLSALIAAQTVIVTPSAAMPTSSTDDQQPAIVETVEAVETASVENANITPSEIAEPHTQQGWYTPNSQTENPKTLKTPQNGAGTHQPLYEGFGGGISSEGSEVESTRGYLFTKPSTQKQKSENQNLKKSNLRAKRASAQTSSTSISAAYGSNSAGSPVSGHKPSLSENRYYQEFLQVHPDWQQFDQERRSPVYQKKARDSFARIREILQSRCSKRRKFPP